MDDEQRAKHDAQLRAQIAEVEADIQRGNASAPAAAGHDARGRFAPGNSGGPGRPRRPVEAAYMRALADVITLEDWTAVCRRAVDDAKAGDGQARVWLARYVLGAVPLSLMDVAVRDELAIGTDAEVIAEARYQSAGAFGRNMDYGNSLERAAGVIREQEGQQADEQRKAERAAKRQAQLAKQTTGEQGPQSGAS